MRLLLLLWFLPAAGAWDAVDHEIFDLVEKMPGRTFYEILGVEQGASKPEINKAYRNKAIELHPDKNNASDAEEQFRDMAAVSEILKDPEKRAKYDHILVVGLPDWKTPVYYVRYAKKLELWHLALLLTVAISIIQYAVAWTSYFEQWSSWQRTVDKERKRLRKQKGKSASKDAEPEMQMPFSRPQLLDVFVFQAPFILLRICLATPAYCRQWWTRLTAPPAPPPASEQPTFVPKTTAPPAPTAPAEMADLGSAAEALQEAQSQAKEALANAQTSSAKGKDAQARHLKVGSEWTAEELNLLSKATAKYPGGTPQRWEKIANEVGREAEEVLKMINKLKKGDIRAKPTSGEAADMKPKSAQRTPDTLKAAGPASSAASSALSSAVRTSKETPKDTPKPPSPASPAGGPVGGKGQQVPKSSTATPPVTPQNSTTPTDPTAWTQAQQKALESALSTVPKDASDRWGQICQLVPGKSKQECMARYKGIVAALQEKRRQQQA